MAELEPQKITITVCELPTEDEAAFENAWKALCDHTRKNQSDVVVLPEMCFNRWLCKTTQKDQQLWQASVHSHEKWISEKLKELSVPVVISSRPAVINGTNYNEGYIWEKDQGIKNIHYKHYLPEEEGVYEQSWYSASPLSAVFNFQGSTATNISSFFAFNIQLKSHQVSAGLLLCSDLWFFQHSRNYGKQGAQLLCVPRATGRQSLDKWVVGGQAASVVSGSFVASSNRKDDTQFGGRGYVISPEGVVLAVTSSEQPFVSVAIDLNEAVAAKKTYPRYIQD